MTTEHWQSKEFGEFTTVTTGKPEDPAANIVLLPHDGHLDCPFGGHDCWSSTEESIADIAADFERHLGASHDD